MKVSMKNGDISTIPHEEIEAYKKYAKEKYPDEIIDEIILEFDNEGYVKLEIHKHSVPFMRIRRITGYLVGTLERFNDGKRAEERDRVKHGVTE
jgi:hypothetical protein